MEEGVAAAVGGGVCFLGLVDYGVGEDGEVVGGAGGGCVFCVPEVEEGAGFEGLEPGCGGAAGVVEGASVD